MTKRIYLLAAIFVCFCFAFATRTTTAEARILTNVNGILCCNEDLNYPIWDSGNHAGSAIDVSSAYIKQETDHYIYIEALDYTVYYEGESMRPKERDFLLRYSKGTGAVEVYSDYFRKFTSELLNPKLIQDTFYLIRMKVGI